MIGRRWISFVVMLGVLFHAYALVRHNTTMINAHIERASLVADLHVLCNPSGSNTIDSATLPDIPRPTDAQHECPVCAGLAVAILNPEPVAEPHYLAFDLPALRPTAHAAPVGSPRTFIPPVRGPPSLA